jgi:hypothetical protein
VHAPNQSPETYVAGPAGEVLDSNQAIFHFSGLDDRTEPANLEYSWNLDSRCWSQFTTSTEILLAGLGKGLHTFEVRARDEEGLIDSTPATIAFTGILEHVPDTPINIHPFSGQTQFATSVTLVALAFLDPDASSIFSSAQFQIRVEGESFETPNWDSGEITPGTSILQAPSDVLQPMEKYWWRARYRDETGLWSAWSAETSFTTESSDTPTPTPTVTNTPTPTITNTATPAVTNTPTDTPAETPTITPSPTSAITQTPIPEDINKDGRVDEEDLLLLLQEWHQGSKDLLNKAERIQME